MAHLFRHHGKNGSRSSRLASMLRILRTRKILEALLAMWGLGEDGREKLRGEYIFDRHYVESLVDESIDRAREMVHHAGLLIGRESEPLQEALEAHRGRAHRVLSLAPEGEKGEESPPRDPEYRLLENVLQWIEGSPPGSEDSLLFLGGCVLDRLFLDARETTVPGVPCPSVPGLPAGLGVYRVEPAARGTEDEDPEDGLHALQSLFRAAGLDRCEDDALGWKAFVSDGHFLLHRGKAPLVQLHAYRRDGPGTDLLLFYAEGPAKLFPQLSPFLDKVIRSPRAVAGWIDARGEDDTDSFLERLGHALFSIPAFRPGGASPHANQR